MWAPADHIDRAHQMAAETADRRAAQRQRAAERRERQEADYQDELADAMVAYLDFADEHADRLIEAQVQTGTVEVDDDTYRRIRREAAAAVEDFIDRHRNPSI